MHSGKIHIIHNSTNSSDTKQRSSSQNRFCTKEAFDETSDVMELRYPPAIFRIVITAIITDLQKT